MTPTDLGHGRGWLDRPAALSIARVDAEIGHPIQITSAGRTRAQQQKAYDAYLAGTGSFAAKPGTSPHEFGNAIDTNERIALLTEHGWRRPLLKTEPWHYVYNPTLDKHYGEDINDMGTIDPTEQNYQTFAAFLQRALKWDVRRDGFGADAKLGPTLWDRLGVIEAAAASGVSIDTGEVAEAIAAAIPDDLAGAVVDELTKRLQS